jgi:hypothetical protein
VALVDADEVPSAQRAGVTVPSMQYLPAAQATQSSRTVALIVARDLPAGHSSGTRELKGQYAPAGQSMHPFEPADSAVAPVVSR